MAWYTPLPQNDPPSCRAAHSCDKVGNFLYVFGGWNGKKALNDLYVLDLDNLVCRSEPETLNLISRKLPKLLVQSQLVATTTLLLSMVTKYTSMVATMETSGLMTFTCWIQWVLFGLSQKLADKNQVHVLVTPCLESGENSICLEAMTETNDSMTSKFLIFILLHGYNLRFTVWFPWRETLILWQCLEANSICLVVIQETNILRTCMCLTQRHLHGQNLRFSVHHRKVCVVIQLILQEIKYTYLVGTTEEGSHLKK